MEKGGREGGREGGVGLARVRVRGGGGRSVVATSDDQGAQGRHIKLALGMCVVVCGVCFGPSIHSSTCLRMSCCVMRGPGCFTRWCVVSRLFLLLLGPRHNKRKRPTGKWSVLFACHKCDKGRWRRQRRM